MEHDRPYDLQDFRGFMNHPAAEKNFPLLRLRGRTPFFSACRSFPLFVEVLEPAVIHRDGQNVLKAADMPVASCSMPLFSANTPSAVLRDKSSTSISPCSRSAALVLPSSRSTATMVKTVSTAMMTARDAERHL